MLVNQSARKVHALFDPYGTDSVWFSLTLYAYSHVHSLQCYYLHISSLPPTYSVVWWPEVINIQWSHLNATPIFYKFGHFPMIWTGVRQTMFWDRTLLSHGIHWLDFRTSQWLLYWFHTISGWAEPTKSIWTYTSFSWPLWFSLDSEPVCSIWHSNTNINCSTR